MVRKSVKVEKLRRGYGVKIQTGGGFGFKKVGTKKEADTLAQKWRKRGL